MNTSTELPTTKKSWRTIINYQNSTWEEAAAGTRLSAVYIAETTLGVLINILLITVIKLGSHTSKEVHVQLINLAIADMVFGATTCAMAIVGQNLTPYSLYPQSEVVCILVVFTYSGLMWSSSLWRMTISIERFVVIYFPFRARNYTHKKKVIVAIAVWICCLLLGCYGASGSSMVKSVHYGFWEGPVNRELCQERSYLPDKLVYAVFLSLLPFFIIIIMYTLIAYKLCKRKQIGESQRMRPSTQSIQVRVPNHEYSIALYLLA